MLFCFLIRVLDTDRVRRDGSGRLISGNEEASVIVKIKVERTR